MKRRSLSLFAALVLVAAVASGAQAHEVRDARPRLVLQLTIDQLRGDMLPRFRDRFGKGGFRRLMEEGLYYSNAHYGTGNTFTASGHAVLVTGADTAEHGMVANEWFDRDAGAVVYSTYDAQHGSSPANLTSTTVGDELVSATAGRAFAVAGKDRSAIIPGGHLGKAFWFSDISGGFVSSTYYYEVLPAWTQAWNDRKLTDAYREGQWQPLGETSHYLNARNAENLYVRAEPGVGFPHPLAADDEHQFLAAFRTTPFLDEYTLSFVQELIRQEKVGQGPTTDYLAVSLSGTDYIGHLYGPNSLEYEDNLLRLDRSLAELLSFLDATIGPERTLIVLSADHGVDDIPEARHAAGYDAKRFRPKEVLERLNAVLRARFDANDDLIVAFAPPGFYLDRRRIALLELEPAAIETALAEELRAIRGVAYAYTRSDLLAGRMPRTSLLDKVQRSYHPSRSGDVVIVQKQFWYLYRDPDCCASMHGSPYSYDTYVPVLFHGAGLPARTIHRLVEPASIAPTLAALLYINPPSGSSAAVLPEVLDRDCLGTHDRGCSGNLERRSARGGRPARTECEWLQVSCSPGHSRLESSTRTGNFASF